MTPDMYDEMTGAWALMEILVLLAILFSTDDLETTRPQDGQEVGDGKTD